MKTLLWLSIGLVVYTYLGYGVVIWALVQLKRRFGRTSPATQMTDWPEVTVVIPAYNESSCLPAKLENTFGLSYPAGRMRVLLVTEGSTDGSTEYGLTQQALRGDQLMVLGGTVRRGKIEAMNRAMGYVSTPLVVFTDANTFLNPEALRNLVRRFADPQVGAVAGEKRILTDENEAAAGAGEGLYWKYESFLKRLDAEWYSIVGAAGELFALRTALYEPVEPDTLLDDFVISLRIAARGYRVDYAPDAYAMERPSYSVGEEKKRKVRIAHGGFQAMARLLNLLNLFRYGKLSFQYVSHRAMRWAVAPFCLPVIFLANLGLAVQAYRQPAQNWETMFWQLLLLGQVLFYGGALLGYQLESRRIRFKLLFVPYYFTFMNYCALLGFGRFLRGNPTGGVWERSRRADETVSLDRPA